MSFVLHKSVPQEIYTIDCTEQQNVTPVINKKEKDKRLYRTAQLQMTIVLFFPIAMYTIA